MTVKSKEIGDGPAVLQLLNWGDSELQVSEFCEAFISPTREHLLLLSHEEEALLIPLSAEAERQTDCSMKSADDSPLPSTSADTLENPDFRHKRNLSAFENYPVIPDAKSVTWGHSGDYYIQFADSDFREVLVISGSGDITIHAFRHCDVNTTSMESAPSREVNVNGQWMNWGSSNSVCSDGPFSSNGSSEFVDDPKNCISSAGRSNYENKIQDADAAVNKPKKCLRTFLTELDTRVSNGKYMGLFPQKSIIPCSAGVVSFSIYNSTLLFLQFLSSISLTDKENQGVEVAEGCLQDETVSHNYKSRACTCSKVFSSSSHDLVGLILTFSEEPIVNSSEADITNSREILVVVVAMHHWGIQWVSSVGLNHINCGSGQWADFQFSDDFLVCLNTSGLICIWGTNTGDLITQLDVVGSCLFGRDLSRDNAPRKSSSVGKHYKKSEIQMTRSDSGYFVKSRLFKRLMVASDSLLLAVVDDQGVIYVLYAGDAVPQNHVTDKSINLSQHSCLGKVADWRAADFDIGGQQSFSFLPKCQHSFNSSTSNGKSNYINRRGTTLRRQEVLLGRQAQFRTSSSFTTAALELNDWKVSDSEYGPMRRVFLPLDRFRDDDSICFSSFGITRLAKCCKGEEKKGCKIVHVDLHLASSYLDEREFYNTGKFRKLTLIKEQTIIGESLGCCFQGFLYLVTKNGLSVVLPSVSVSVGGHQQDSYRCTLPNVFMGSQCNIKDLLMTKEVREPLRPWQVEILDRILLYEGHKEAELVCSENGWDLSFARLRQLLLSLQYLKYDEIEKSFDMLADGNLAEEGILQLLYFCAHHICCGAGKDSEIVLASRILALASRFATKMIRRYRGFNLKEGKRLSNVGTNLGMPYMKSGSPMQDANELTSSRRLFEMAYYLEVIRDLESRLASKSKRPGQAVAGDAKNLVDEEVSQGEGSLPIVTLGIFSSRQLDMGAQDREESSTSSTPELASGSSSTLALQPLEPSAEIIKLQDTGVSQWKNPIPAENPKDMITRWYMDDLDPKTIVEDALYVGRLPLAVLQLHLQRKRVVTFDKEPHDTFIQVREIGRAIAYELFLKGESEPAIATLKKLGENIEFDLRQLLFGTLRRSLRAQIAEEMRILGYLTPNESKILEKISLIERVYSSNDFWGAYFARHKDISQEVLTDTYLELNNHSLSFCISDYGIIECGNVDGVVIGSWANIELLSSSINEDNPYSGYWVCAAVWSDAWDGRTIDRILIDQPSHVEVVPWESQFEYAMSRNNLEEVYKLLSVVPAPLLLDGSLKITRNYSCTAADDRDFDRISNYGNYICLAEESEPLFLDIPRVKIFKCAAIDMCSSWLKALIEEELARNFIFLNECWHNSSEFMPLVARASLLSAAKISMKGGSSDLSLDIDTPNHGNQSKNDTAEAVHRFVIYYCSRYNLPHLLDLYLDQHHLLQDDHHLSSLQQAAGNFQWAKWLLSSRVNGHEYEASFYNARSSLSRQMHLSNNLAALECDEMICTVDDIAEGGGEMAALATLVYAELPIEMCLHSGSVNRQNHSSQCTLENLRPGLQHFPTVWKTLVSSCYGQDPDVCPFNFYANCTLVKSAFFDFLNWRNNIFMSTGGDTSLDQMLPWFFPNSVRRLLRIFVQGPIGWQSSAAATIGESFLFRNDNYSINMKWNGGATSVSWEESTQKNIEKELFSSAEEKGYKLEHHLHRGRPLAAFNNLLRARSTVFESANLHQQESDQPNIQSDVQVILAALAQTERSALSSAVPLAIMNFEDPVLVSSCAFLLELCGVSAHMLRVDIAALRRISSYHHSLEQNGHNDQVSPKSSAFHAMTQKGSYTFSLARGLADDYIVNDHLNLSKNRDEPSKLLKEQPSLALISVLHHLEKASLPPIVVGNTCGSWLSNGFGDGSELRTKQRDASQYWSLVNMFCQMHHLPLSTQYLILLAKDNDWVGFLTEAQAGGFSIDVIIRVAAEFSDPRLKTHMLTVLNSSQFTRKKTSSITRSSSARESESYFINSGSMEVPVELFGILADCEKRKNPGQAILAKAKDLRWSLLAMIASCFPDVTPLSCLTTWLQITAARETSSIKVDDVFSKLKRAVGAAVEVTNGLSIGSRNLEVHYNRRNAKRRRVTDPSSESPFSGSSSITGSSFVASISQEAIDQDLGTNVIIEQSNAFIIPDEGQVSLSNMVAVLCEQHLFLPLIRAFELFLPSCALLPFIRSLQTFSQMRLSEASTHLALFSSRIKEEQSQMDGLVNTSWISSTAVKASEAMLSRCPSAYEKRFLLQLLAGTDFADGGVASTYFRRLYWKINLAEPSLGKDNDVYLGNEILDDGSLLSELVKNGRWEQARNWAKQLESSGASWKSATHHVTEAQAEAMVVEWKEYLWDVPEERAALWNHCQTLFMRYSFPPLQAGLFFLKHADAIEKDIPATELHEMLLLSLQWLSGTITQSPVVYPLHLLREIETRVWLLAVESEPQFKDEPSLTSLSSIQNFVGGSNASIIDYTASIIAKMDNHINSMRFKSTDKNGIRDNSVPHPRSSHVLELSSPKMKRRTKQYIPLRRPGIDNAETTIDSEEYLGSRLKSNSDSSQIMLLQEESMKTEAVSGWDERVKPAEMEKAVLSLLEFGQIAAAKQLQQKLSPTHVPLELTIVDAALKIAILSSSHNNQELDESILDEDSLSIIQSIDLPRNHHMVEPLQILESLATKCSEGCGLGLCKRILAVVKAAKILGLPFSEAFEKKPTELLQLLSLKAQDSFNEARLLVLTHQIPPSNIARILAESFLKGLLAAHRGGYLDSQKEEGPAPLLWRFADFLKWAELCPSEPEIGHALMRLVMTAQEIPHACEVELLILSHHFYKSSACLDGVDVLVTFVANRVDSYMQEGDFSCLARLVTGVSDFHALNFILNLLIENGQLELLLQKYSAADIATGASAAVRGFRMAVLTSLQLFHPDDLDAFAMVYDHFDMKHETASLLESRSISLMKLWLSLRDKDRQTEDLLGAMRHFVEAAEVLSTVDAGQKTRHACAQASLLSLQIRIPDIQWIELPETKARRALVDQWRFQEALIVAEAYNLNQPSEWTLVLWNRMLKPELLEEFLAGYVSVLPLQPTMLFELVKFYRAEVAARGDQSHFSVWLSPGGLPADWNKHLGRSFKSLLRRTREMRLRLQLATNATGFMDVIDACNKVMDKVPENVGPLILRRGHGGAYQPLM